MKDFKFSIFCTAEYNCSKSATDRNHSYTPRSAATHAPRAATSSNFNLVVLLKYSECNNKQLASERKIILEKHSCPYQ